MTKLSEAAMFVLELAVYIAVAYWAFHLTDHFWLGVVLALVAIAVMGTVWSLLGSPQSPYALTGPVRIVFELAWFGLGVLAFVFGGLWYLGILLALGFGYILYLRLRPRA